jgi:phosphate/phosphite/phosphonate ABC transporter binding protein
VNDSIDRARSLTGLPPVEVPTHVGRYHLMSRIARGGMAEIYLASERGLAGFERLVVIKRILVHLADDPSFVEMFLREARIIARLNHPNIVHIHELGEDDGDYFIAMEYIQGCTVRELQSFCAAQGVKMPLSAAASITLDACRGAHAAHELRGDDGALVGLVHRDISPHNLMLNDAGVVKLLDFGVAKTTTSTGEATFSGSLKGKFSYMSPEQVRGAPLDRRSDVFALGIVLWELCTDRTLFQRPTELEMMKVVSKAIVPKPSEIDDTIPPALEAVIMKALAREPADRFPSAEAMRLALVDAARSSGFDTGSDTLSVFVKQLAGDEISTRHQRLLEGQGETSLSVVSRRQAMRVTQSELEPATVSARPGTSPGAQPQVRTSVPVLPPDTPQLNLRPKVASAPSSIDIPIYDGRDEDAPHADPFEMISGSIDIPIVVHGEGQTLPSIPSLKIAQPIAPPAEVATSSARMRWVWLGALALALVFVAWWWGRGTPSVTTSSVVSAGPSGAPLVMGWPPTFDSDLLLAEVEPLRLYLEAHLERPVRFIVSSDYDALAVMLRSGEVQFAMLTPLLMVRTLAVDPRIQPVVLRTYDGAVGSDAYLVVRQDPSIQRLDDLRGKRFCFTDPSSTSGYFLPNAFISQSGFNPERFIGSIQWSGDHFQVLRDLIDGKCEAAALFSGAWINADRRGIPVSQLRMLTVTGHSPQDTVCAAPDADPDEVATLKALLLAFDPQQVTGNPRLGETQRITSFVEPRPEMFSSLRAAQHHAWARTAAGVMRQSTLAGAVRGSLPSPAP